MLSVGENVHGAQLHLSFLQNIFVGQSWVSANLEFGSVHLCVSSVCASVLTGIELSESYKDAIWRPPRQGRG